jgi:hypothetical protein
MAEPHVETEQPTGALPQQRKDGPHASFGGNSAEPSPPSHRRQPLPLAWLEFAGEQWPWVVRARLAARRWLRATGRTVVRWRLALGAVAVAPLLLALLWPGRPEKPVRPEPRLAPTHPGAVSSTPSAPSAVDHEPELFDRIRDERSVPFDELSIDRGD